MDDKKLVSHSDTEVDLDQALAEARNRIANQDCDDATKKENLRLLEELATFGLGEYIIRHGGANGFWTDYFLTHQWRRGTDLVADMSSLERFILDKSPIILATQERFQIFLEQNQQAVRNGAKLACVPSGLMGELLYLDYSGIKDIELVGIDLDQDSLKQAMTLAQEKGLEHFVTFDKEDAWHLHADSAFDLITSNGLNIYVQEEEKLVALYRSFFSALAPGGKLVTSFVTPPPTITDRCEWNFDAINLDDLNFQKRLFTEVLQGKWQCYCSSEKMEAILSKVGFSDITFHYDRQHMFPAIVAEKPSASSA